MLISQSLSPTALKQGAQPAFKYLKFTVSYKEFWETSNRFSYYIQKEIGNGKRVGLWMSNCPHVAYAFIALSNTKNCTVPLNPWATPEENIFKIKNSEISVMFCTSDLAKSLKEFLQQNGLGAIKVVDIEGKRCAEYDTSYTAPANHVPLEKDDILLLYTPGTTGKFKGCVFDHKNLVQAMTAVKNSYRALGTDVFYTQGHYSNAFQWIHYLLAPLMAGSCVFISDQVDYKEILTNLTEKRVTRFAPKLNSLPELLACSEAEKIPIVTLKTISVTGTGSFTKEIWTRIQTQTKASVCNVFGLTEFLGTVAMSNADVKPDFTKPSLCGPPMVGVKIRVVDDNNDEIDKKKPQKGQLLVMGPQLMTRYLNLPEDQKITVRGTWLFTGDIVDIDAAGNVVFLERKADIVVLQNGTKVFPKEIEPHLKGVPQIEDLAYVGIRDRLKKPVPALVVVKKPQTQLNEKQVMDFLATKVFKDKLPVQIFFIDAMPRTPSGAINRGKLRSQFDGM